MEKHFTNLYIQNDEDPKEYLFLREIAEKERMIT